MNCVFRRWLITIDRQGKQYRPDVKQDMNGRTADRGNRPPAGQIAIAKAGTPSSKDIRRLDLDALLAGRRECIIVHDDSEYRLRITSNGKLILTK